MSFEHDLSRLGHNLYPFFTGSLSSDTHLLSVSLQSTFNKISLSLYCVCKLRTKRRTEWIQKSSLWTCRLSCCSLYVSKCQSSYLTTRWWKVKKPGWKMLSVAMEINWNYWPCKLFDFSEWLLPALIVHYIPNNIHNCFWVCEFSWIYCTTKPRIYWTWDKNGITIDGMAS